MKHLSGQIFPIALLGTLAGLTFMLQAALTPDNAPDKGPPAHEPDAIVEQFEIRRLDEQGQLKYRLQAPRLVHFPDDDSTEIDAPRLLTYRPDAPPLIVSGKRALVTTHGEQVHLTGDVRILRTADAGRPELLARTATLTIEPDRGLAYTDQPVTITQGSSWITGTGARIDNNASLFELHAQVRGHHDASKARP